MSADRSVADVTDGAGAKGHRVAAKRVSDPVEREDGHRVLIERLWPRGLARDKVHFDEWLPITAPSEELSDWYEQHSNEWQEFERRYRDELREPSRRADLDALTERARLGSVTLLCVTDRLEHSTADVLRAFLTDLLNAAS